QASARGSKRPALTLLSQRHSIRSNALALPPQGPVGSVRFSSVHNVLSATSRLSTSGAKMTSPPRFNLSHLRRSQLFNCLLTLSRDAPISWLMSRCVTLNFCEALKEE